MSHNIALAGVRISNLDILAEAVSKLTNNACRLVKGQKNFRTYQGQPTNCDHAIVVAGSSYDIGIRAEKDGTFSLVADFTMMAGQSPFSPKHLSYGDFLTQNRSDRTNYDQAAGKYAVGALMQEYILIQAEDKASRLGRRTQRVPGKNGTVALEIVER